MHAHKAVFESTVRQTTIIGKRPRVNGDEETRKLTLVQLVAAQREELANIARNMMWQVRLQKEETKKLVRELELVKEMVRAMREVVCSKKKKVEGEGRAGLNGSGKGNGVGRLDKVWVDYVAKANGDAGEGKEGAGEKKGGEAAEREVEAKRDAPAQGAVSAKVETRREREGCPP